MGLFARRTAYVGLGLISFGPPVVGLAVHCYYWTQLPGNEAAGNPTGGLSRRLRWRWRHNWRRMRGKAPERELEFTPDSLESELHLESDFALQVPRVRVSPDSNPI